MWSERRGKKGEGEEETEQWREEITRKRFPVLFQAQVKEICSNCYKKHKGILLVCIKGKVQEQFILNQVPNSMLLGQELFTFSMPWCLCPGFTLKVSFPVIRCSRQIEEPDGRKTFSFSEVPRKLQNKCCFFGPASDSKRPCAITMACHMFFPGTDWEEDRLGERLGLSRSRKKRSFPKEESSDVSRRVHGRGSVYQWMFKGHQTLK